MHVPGEEGCETSHNAGGAACGAGFKRRGHGPKLHAVVCDGRMCDVAGPPLLLLQAHLRRASVHERLCVLLQCCQHCRLQDIG